MLDSIGKHDKSCFIKQEYSRTALGYKNENKNKNLLIDLTQKNV